MKQELTQQTTRETFTTISAASLTVSAGLGTYLKYIPPILGSVASFAGIIFTVVLTYKALVDMKYKREDRRYKAELRKDLEERREKNLPCRRCTDSEILGHDK